MKKIMFNDKYGLTQAVLEGRKTMTRRTVPMHDYKYGFQVLYDRETKQCCVCDGSFILERSRYSRGEVVAIAQSYKDIYEKGGFDMHNPFTFVSESAGWTNKMFVKADSMPHHIKITNIRVERLQDISDTDCIYEGIGHYFHKFGVIVYKEAQVLKIFGSLREAFAALIDKVSGKGTWDSNPLVWVYEFELVD